MYTTGWRRLSIGQILDGVMGQAETNLPAGGDIGRPSN
jgi:hypothetical protein